MTDTVEGIGKEAGVPLYAFLHTENSRVFEWKWGCVISVITSVNIAPLVILLVFHCRLLRKPATAVLALGVSLSHICKNIFWLGYSENIIMNKFVPGESRTKWFDRFDFTRQLSQYFIVGYAIHRYLIICDREKSIKFLRSLPSVVVFILSTSFFRMFSLTLYMWITLDVFPDQYLTLRIVRFLIDQPIFLILSTLHVIAVHKMNNELNRSILFLRSMIHNGEVQARITDKLRLKLFNSFTLVLQMVEWIVKLVFDLMPNLPYICHRYEILQFCMDADFGSFRSLLFYVIFNSFTESICTLFFSVFHLTLMPSYHRALTTCQPTGFPSCIFGR